MTDHENTLDMLAAVRRAGAVKLDALLDVHTAAVADTSPDFAGLELLRTLGSDDLAPSALLAMALVAVERLADAGRLHRLLAAAIEAAEAKEHELDDGSHWHHEARGYSAGLRSAARFFDLREANHPTLRHRYPKCRAAIIPCDTCRDEAVAAARSTVGVVGDVISPFAADVPDNVTEVRDAHERDLWQRLDGADRLAVSTDGLLDGTEEYDWGTAGGGGYTTTDGLLDMGPLTITRIRPPKEASA